MVSLHTDRIKRCPRVSSATSLGSTFSGLGEDLGLGCRFASAGGPTVNWPVTRGVGIMS